MNCWSFLDMQPSKDKSEIKKNYARMLKANHPEDNPNYFMDLNSAYKQAIIIAESNIYESYDDDYYDEDEDEYDEDDESDFYDDSDHFQKPIKINTPNYFVHEPYTTKIEKESCWLLSETLYNNFEARIDLKNWKKLYINMELVTLEQFYLVACDFFNTHYYFPLDVWEYLVEEFSLLTRKEFNKNIYVKVAFQIEIDADFFHQHSSIVEKNYIEKYEKLALAKQEIEKVVEIDSLKK